MLNQTWDGDSHILSSNFRKCVVCKVCIKLKNFGKFFKFVTLTLSSFDLGSNKGNHEATGGVPSECRCSSCSSFSMFYKQTISLDLLRVWNMCCWESNWINFNIADVLAFEMLPVLVICTFLYINVYVLLLNKGIHFQPTSQFHGIIWLGPK